MTLQDMCACIDMHKCMYMYVIYMYVCIHLVYMYVCILKCIYVCKYTCVCIYMNV